MGNEPKVCNHLKWNIDSQNIGTCANPKCGEVRQFPFSAGEPVIVLKESKCNSQIKKEEVKEKPGRKPRKPGRKKASRHGSLFERSRYYEKNKEAIIADLFAMGRTATCEKWNIPKGTIGKLERRWLTEKQRSEITADGSQQPKTQKDGLPAFPEFSMTWDPTVQVKWLEVWPEIYKLHEPTTRLGGNSGNSSLADD
jgi:hypothetical protein